MSALSNHLEDALMAAVYKGTSYTTPTNTYIALFNSNPGEDNSGTECTGSGYARYEMASGDWTAISNGSISNATNVNFPAATGVDWGTISHVGIYDASTAGNLLHYGALNSSVTVENSDVFVFAANQLTLTLE
jgi:hypothetical protein